MLPTSYNDGTGFGDMFDGGIVLSVDKVFVGVVPVVEWWLWVEWCVVVGGALIIGKAMVVADVVSLFICTGVVTAVVVICPISTHRDRHR